MNDASGQQLDAHRPHRLRWRRLAHHKSLSSSLWLFWLPLLFLPDMGLQRETPFGILRLPDYLIGIYLALLLVARRGRRPRSRTMAASLAPLAVVFLVWAGIGTFTIPLRYGYPVNNQMLFGLLKLGKLSLYALAGALTIQSVADRRNRDSLNWSLLCAGFVVGLSLVLSRYENPSTLVATVVEEKAYQDNVISVTVAILSCYLLGLVLKGAGTRGWRLATITGLVVMFLGTLLASGRGGWLATLVGISFLLFQVKLRRALVAVWVAALGTLFAYGHFPTFKSQIDKTLWPDKALLDVYGAGFAGIDDGSRLRLWRAEGAKLVDAPLLGRGLFHRGGESGLRPMGSHSFFIQMFLETGLPGGILVIAIVALMWRHAGSHGVRLLGLDVPVRAALVAATCGALGGEYFYGGTTVLALLATYACVGSLPNHRLASPPLRWRSRGASRAAG